VKCLKICQKIYVLAYVSGGSLSFLLAIIKAISKLKTNAAAGPDYIPPIFIKYCSDSIVVPLSFLFNHIF